MGKKKSKKFETEVELDGAAIIQDTVRKIRRDLIYEGRILVGFAHPFINKAESKRIAKKVAAAVDAEHGLTSIVALAGVLVTVIGNMEQDYKLNVLRGLVENVKKAVEQVEKGKKVKTIER